MRAARLYAYIHIYLVYIWLCEGVFGFGVPGKFVSTQILISLPATAACQPLPAFRMCCAGALAGPPEQHSQEHLMFTIVFGVCVCLCVRTCTRHRVFPVFTTLSYTSGGGGEKKNNPGGQKVVC